MGFDFFAVVRRGQDLNDLARYRFARERGTPERGRIDALRVGNVGHLRLAISLLSLPNRFLNVRRLPTDLG